MNATKLLTSLILASTLFGSAAFAQDTLKVSIDGNGRHVVAFTLHGKSSCMLVDDKVSCVPNVASKPVRLASSDED